jgi:hypothetical protein
MVEEKQLKNLVKDHYKYLLMTNQRDEACFIAKDEQISFDEENKILNLNVLEDVPKIKAFLTAKVLITHAKNFFNEDIKINCKNHKYEFSVSKSTDFEKDNILELQMN